MPRLPSGYYRVSINIFEISLLKAHYEDALQQLDAALKGTDENPILADAIEEKKRKVQTRIDEVAKFTDGRRNNKPPKRTKNQPVEKSEPSPDD